MTGPPAPAAADRSQTKIDLVLKHAGQLGTISEFSPLLFSWKRRLPDLYDVRIAC